MAPIAKLREKVRPLSRLPWLKRHRLRGLVIRQGAKKVVSSCHISHRRQEAA
jgi:hypothetical protein